MQYRLLALDLDGTVVNHDLSVSPRVRKAIEAAQRAGVIVTTTSAPRTVFSRSVDVLIG